ncbi:MAG: ABC transporter substrate-binding protein, partial [Thermodesulfobacteriota bacterium]
MKLRSFSRVLVSSFVLWLVGPIVCAAQEPPIMFGFMFVLSGTLANYGTSSRQGAELAIEELNAAGGVLGRKVVALFEDT